MESKTTEDGIGSHISETEKDLYLKGGEFLSKL
jgi:hypothetical protein